jgi:hypothetical protein
MSARPPCKIPREIRETREALRHKGFELPGQKWKTGIPGKNRAAGFPFCRRRAGRR